MQKIRRAPKIHEVKEMRNTLLVVLFALATSFVALGQPTTTPTPATVPPTAPPCPAVITPYGYICAGSSLIPPAVAPATPTATLAPSCGPNCPPPFWYSGLETLLWVGLIGGLVAYGLRLFFNRRQGGGGNIATGQTTVTVLPATAQVGFTPYLVGAQPAPVPAAAAPAPAAPAAPGAPWNCAGGHPNAAGTTWCGTCGAHRP